MIVSHAAATKLLVGHFAGIEIENVWDDPFMHSASLSIIEFEEGIGKSETICRYKSLSINVKRPQNGLFEYYKTSSYVFIPEVIEFLIFARWEFMSAFAIIPFVSAIVTVFTMIA